MLKTSICMSTHNKPDLLRNTLKSIYRQRPGFDFETIVVDDGSIDQRIANVCKDFPVRYHRINRAPGFRNPCVARNVAYKMAQSDIIIAQSDEVLHVSDNTIQYLTEELKPGQFLMANVFCLGKKGNIDGYFVGPKRPVPFFFLGSLWREDLFFVGGNDEEFIVAPAWEDLWFGDCLINGRKLTPVFSTDIVGHHQWHEYTSRPENETASKDLYYKKKALAEQGKIAWQSAAGAWPFIPAPKEEKTKDVKSFFTSIYESNHWGCEESRSGFGSTLEATKVLRRKMASLFDRLKIKSLLDIPCGDFNWMSQLDLSNISYIGADIVAKMIEDNTQRYPSKKFITADLLNDPLPKSDLILCRDCLQHFSPEDVLRAVKNMRASGSKYLLATTFTNKDRSNSSIQTGQWSPHNLQLQPFNWPAPLEVLNEDCQEWYPHFNDKSLGLWELSELEKSLCPIKSLVVCVEYDDFLSFTLPRNKHHFSKTLVVTSPHDQATIDLAAKEGVECFVTDAFYRHGADFNKGLAIEEAFDVLGRNGWICVWDADIIFPSDIYFPREESCLYSPKRFLLEDLSPKVIEKTINDPKSWTKLPCPTQPHEFDGYAQLFHASAIQPPWYGTQWKHAGGGDSDFEAKFQKDRLQRMPFPVLHLGSEGMPETGTRVGRNWCGRVIPRIDGKPQPKDSTQREVKIKEYLRIRKKEGLSNEHITLEELQQPINNLPSRIPKLMSFFWTGEMSWLRYMTLYSFRKYNPDWSICVYSPKNTCKNKTWKTHEDADTCYRGIDYTNQLDSLRVERKTWEHPNSKNLAPAHACDILEWYVLGTTGGFFSDMDILWLRPMESLLQRYGQSDALFCLEDGRMAIGFFGSAPDCRLFRDVYRKTGYHQIPKGYQFYGTEHLFRVAVLSPRQINSPIAGKIVIDSFKQRYRHLQINTVPDATVYPFDWREIPDIFESNLPVPTFSYGIHWFGGSPIAQKWNNLLTSENYQRYQTTLTNCLKKVLS